MPGKRKPNLGNIKNTEKLGDKFWVINFEISSYLDFCKYGLLPYHVGTRTPVQSPKVINADPGCVWWYGWCDL